MEPPLNYSITASADKIAAMILFGKAMWWQFAILAPHFIYMFQRLFTADSLRSLIRVVAIVLMLLVMIGIFS